MVTADPITYDDEGNVIPLQERFNPESEDIRYSARTSKEIAPEPDYEQMGVAVYNGRGWAYNLLTKKERAMFHQKVSEQLIGRKQKSRMLRDGTHVITVNNKILFVAGRFNEPIIKGVLFVDAKNEQDLEFAESLLFEYGGRVTYEHDTEWTIQRKIYNSDRVLPVLYEGAERHRANSLAEIRSAKPVLPESFHSFDDTRNYVIRGGVYTEDVGDFSEGTGENEEERVHENGVNTLYSLRAVDPVQPSSNLWSRTSTTEEAMKRFPNLWNVTAETSEKRNPTQIASTKGTYRNIYNILKREDLRCQLRSTKQAQKNGSLEGSRLSFCLHRKAQSLKSTIRQVKS